MFRNAWVFLGLFAMACDGEPVELVVQAPTPRQALWNLVTTGNEANPAGGPSVGNLPADPHYRSWKLMPAFDDANEFKNKPLHLPVHGRYVTVYVNDIAYNYLDGYLRHVAEGGEVPVAELPAGSIVLKENYPSMLVNGELVQAPDAAVLTMAVKPSLDNCQSNQRFGDNQCLGGAWDWEFYGLNAPNKPRHHLDGPVAEHTTSFCVNCHNPGVRTDYLRGLQRIVDHKSSTLTPLRDAAPSPGAATPADFAGDPFCNAVLTGSALPSDVALDPTSVDPAQRQRMFDCLSWRSFAALNWPAQPDVRGAPQPVAHMTDEPTASRVWETYKATWEVFQPTDITWDPTKTDAGEWQTPRPRPPSCAAVPDSDQLAVVAMVSKASTNADVVNEEGQAFAGSFGTLADRNGKLVRYQVLVDETEFNALVPTAITKGLTTAGPGKGVQQGKATRLPDGSTEVKASWKFMCTDESACKQVDDPANYYVKDVLIYKAGANGEPSTCERESYGLVGLHVARKTFWAPQWIWATFEHRLNAPIESKVDASLDYSFFDAACTPFPMNPAGPHPDCSVQPFLVPKGKGNQCCPNSEINRFPPANLPTSEVPNQITRMRTQMPDDLNTAYAEAFKGTPWANYFLVSTQWPLNGRHAALPDGSLPVNNQLCKSQWDIQDNPLKDVTTDAPTDCYTMVPNELRNTSMESYMTSYVNHGGAATHVSNRSCMGCHASGVDFSYLWLDGVEQVVLLGE